MQADIIGKSQNDRIHIFGSLGFGLVSGWLGVGDAYFIVAQAMIIEPMEEDSRAGQPTIGVYKKERERDREGSSGRKWLYKEL